MEEDEERREEKDELKEKRAGKWKEAEEAEGRVSQI